MGVTLQVTVAVAVAASFAIWSLAQKYSKTCSFSFSWRLHSKGLRGEIVGLWHLIQPPAPLPFRKPVSGGGGAGEVGQGSIESSSKSVMGQMEQPEIRPIQEAATSRKKVTQMGDTSRMKRLGATRSREGRSIREIFISKKDPEPGGILEGRSWIE